MTISSPNESGTSEAAQHRLLQEESFVDEVDEEEEEQSVSSEDDDDDDDDEDASFSRFSGDKSSTADQSNSADQEAREKLEVEALIRRETRSVLTWRETVTGILMIIGFVSSVAAFVFFGKEEHVAFETAFEEAALVLTNKYMADTRGLARNTKVLADLVTANAIGTNSSWPLVTVPFFEIYGRNIRSEATSDLVLSAPLVSDETRAAWEDYSVKNQGWIVQGQAIANAADMQQMLTDNNNQYDNPMKSEEETTTTAAKESNSSSTDDHHDSDDNHVHYIDQGIPQYIHLGLTDTEIQPVPQGQGPYCPVWQVSPPPTNNTGVVNLDLFSFPEIASIYSHLVNDVVSLDEVQPVVSGIVDLGHASDEQHFLTTDAIASSGGHSNDHAPYSLMLAPVADRLLDNNQNQPRPVGLVAISFVWHAVFANVLPEETVGIQVTIRNTCDEEHPFTYMLNGSAATYMGVGEHQIDTFYEAMEIVVVSSDFVTEPRGGCSYSVHLMPTRELRKQQNSDEKILFTLAVAGLFVIIGIVFHFYDLSVQRRNEKMLKTAAKSNRIVSSLFPSTVKKRLFEDDDDMHNNNNRGGRASKGGTTALAGLPGVHSSKPLADFFPEATVLFADIVGFTAWSSVREPSQVFVLLETIYTAFDSIAKRRRIFKIETIGDCYVATAGLPEPRADHAPAMARFADECQSKMADLTACLEETLGPDTGDLSMRIGIHSGPVTAGVLRGERSRFQLFGDTVNTAARLESSGKPGRIHVSAETAKLLTEMGKGKWLTAREDKVFAKGKGALTTFWLSVKGHGTSSVASSSAHSELSQSEAHVDGQGPSIGGMRLQNGLSSKSMRLVNWNVEILARLLKQIVGRRRATKSNLFPSFGMNEDQLDQKVRSGRMVSDEVVEVITLPKYNAAAASASERYDADLADDVVDQLRDFVTMIAKGYKEKNTFHNFEHASHVTMSVSKLLSRIIAPKLEVEVASSRAMHDKLLHDHTYGITSDPLTQFACIWSALVHDVEHDGVPNTQLVKEGSELAARYQNQSVAEQNSVDVAWDLLMQPRFKELRATIYSDAEEMIHFRKLVVNCVMATDISDKRLKDLRNKRWDRAFAAKSAIPESEEEKEEISVDDELELDVNRKATIVIEHLLQASDVSHTMQHWHVFRKWNENLFMEMYTAFREGRAENDPAVFWYKGEIGFFDFYVIPLAKKLSQCGVFGVSSDEYLNYAESNRNEWESRGKEVVAELAAKAKARYEERHGSGGGGLESMPVLKKEPPARESSSNSAAAVKVAKPQMQVLPESAPPMAVDKAQPASEVFSDEDSIEV